jgi:hypothetical protein
MAQHPIPLGKLGNLPAPPQLNLPGGPPVAPQAQGQPQLQPQMQPNAGPGNQGNQQAQGQPQIQPQMQPNAGPGNQGNQQAQGQQQCGCAPGLLCQQHAAASNPILRCIKFLASWDCGPIGTIIAAGAFAAGTVLTFYAFKLAIWTATKDYIEHCQSDVVRNIRQ